MPGAGQDAVVGDAAPARAGGSVGGRLLGGRLPRRWTLRARLIAVMAALMALVSLVVGLVSVFELRNYLLDRLDDKVSAAAQRTVRNQDPTRGQDEDTLIAAVRGGKLIGNVLVMARTGAAGVVVPTDTAPLSTVPADGREHTRDLGGDLGEYRLRSIPVGSGVFAVTGLPLRGVRNAVLRLWATFLLVAGTALVGGVALAAWVVRLTLRPLRRVSAVARHVSGLPLHQGEVALSTRVPDEDTDPRTEVGQVGAALNAMLDHVGAALTARQASETRVRRFVADASHELRTPLAAIRGYAELGRRRPDVETLSDALGRVESNAVRMTSLVEDLLLLASLDSGRSILIEDVDLSLVLVEAIRDAQVAGPDHRWQLDLPDEPVIVSGEAPRLTQVVVNLLSNARIHTPPGTTVTVGLQSTATHAEISVTDNGPGIPPDLLPEVFGRFARGDSSRSRAAGSTGLGLSIVHAIVTAHHGTVTVSSRPGHTTFRVQLPVEQQLALERG
jgi:two-component system OmpR family sensor kinase